MKTGTAVMPARVINVDDVPANAIPVAGNVVMRGFGEALITIPPDTQLKGTYVVVRKRRPDALGIWPFVQDRPAPTAPQATKTATLPVITSGAPPINARPINVPVLNVINGAATVALPANVDPKYVTVVKKGLSWLDKFTQQVTQVADTVSDVSQRVNRSAQGAAAGAKAGYEAPTTTRISSPLLFAGGGLLLFLLLSKK